MGGYAKGLVFITDNPSGGFSGVVVKNRKQPGDKHIIHLIDIANRSTCAAYTGRGIMYRVILSYNLNHLCSTCKNKYHINIL